VFYKRIQDAQQSVKASMSASADESLASSSDSSSSTAAGDAGKQQDGIRRRGAQLPAWRSG